MRERLEVAIASCAKARSMGTYASSAAGFEPQKLTQFLAFDAKIVYIVGSALSENNKRHPRRKIAKPSRSLEEEKRSFNINHLFQIGGHPFMTSTKYQVFDPTLLSTWAGPPLPSVDVHTRST